MFDSSSEVCCDWLSFVHEYQVPVEVRDAGRTLKLTADGEIEWESMAWEQVRCPSSDTSLRIRCDGRTLRASGNIGRFGEASNVLGVSVLDCVGKWGEVLHRLGYDLTGFGSRWGRRVQGNVVHADAWAAGGVLDVGTTLTRVDLAGNFDVSDYAGLCHAMSVRRIGRRMPSMGRYGPVWGYDAKRANWWKAKLYDKAAEVCGKRRSSGGPTLARFEVQLGIEWLKRERLDKVMAWESDDMTKVVYGRFAQEVFRDSVEVSNWNEIPARLRCWATLWRDGRDLRCEMSRPSFFRVQKALREYGIDVGVPCNVLALTRHVQLVEVRPAATLRRVA